MLELFQGFGMDFWSMCDVVLPALKECVPSCVGVLTPRYAIPLCLTGSRVRCVSPSCLWSESTSVTNIDRLGDVVGIPGWRNASLVYVCLTGCFCVWSLWQPLCLTWWEVWGVLFQPIHTPFPASRILNELVQGTAIWLLCLRLHCLNSLCPVGSSALQQLCSSAGPCAQGLCTVSLWDGP